MRTRRIWLPLRVIGNGFCDAMASGGGGLHYNLRCMSVLSTARLSPGASIRVLYVVEIAEPYYSTNYKVVRVYIHIEGIHMITR